MGNSQTCSSVCLCVQPCYLRDWELRLQFKIHGEGKKNLNGDGLAIWLTKERMQIGTRSPIFQIFKILILRDMTMIQFFILCVFSSRSSVWKHKLFYRSGCFYRHLSQWWQAAWGISPHLFLFFFSPVKNNNNLTCLISVSRSENVSFYLRDGRERECCIWSWPWRTVYWSWWLRCSCS